MQTADDGSRLSIFIQLKEPPGNVANLRFQQTRVVEQVAQARQKMPLHYSNNRCDVCRCRSAVQHTLKGRADRRPRVALECFRLLSTNPAFIPVGNHESPGLPQKEKPCKLRKSLFELRSRPTLRVRCTKACEQPRQFVKVITHRSHRPSLVCSPVMKAPRATRRESRKVAGGHERGAPTGAQGRLT